MLKCTKYLSSIKRMPFVSNLIWLINLQSLIIVTKSSTNIFNVSEALDLPLVSERGGGIQLLRSHLGVQGERAPTKIQMYVNRGETGALSMQTFAYKSVYLVQSLLAIIIRFFVSFIKIPVLFKISVLKERYLAFGFEILQF